MSALLLQQYGKPYFTFPPRRRRCSFLVFQYGKPHLTLPIIATKAAFYLSDLPLSIYLSYPGHIQVKDQIAAGKHTVYSLSMVHVHFPFFSFNFFQNCIILEAYKSDKQVLSSQSSSTSEEPVENNAKVDRGLAQIT